MIIISPGSPLGEQGKVLNIKSVNCAHDLENHLLIHFLWFIYHFPILPGKDYERNMPVIYN